MPAGYWDPQTGQTAWKPGTPEYKRALEYYQSQQKTTPANMAIQQAQQDLSGVGSMAQINQQAAAAADPFASQRPQYQNALQNLMQGQFTPSDPSYDWRFKQGQQALERSAAKGGFLGSGNILQELQQYGQGMGSQEYQNQYNRLLPLTGATTGSPGAAGGIQAGLYDWRNNALANLGAGLQQQQQVGGATTNYGLVFPGQQRQTIY